MHSGKLSLGLIVSFLLVFVYQPQACAQIQNRNVISQAEPRSLPRETADSGPKPLTTGIQNNIEMTKKTSEYPQQVSSKLLMENNVKVNNLILNREMSKNVSTPINNTDVEQFDNVDENNKKERTFPFITNFISNLMNRRTCIYPCTLEAFQEEQCCPPEILPVPVPITPQHCNTCNSPTFPQQFQPNFLPQLPGRFPNQIPYPSFNAPRTPQRIPFPYAPPFVPPFQGQFPQQFPQQFPCCSVCTQYTFYGPPPCQFF